MRDHRFMSLLDELLFTGDVKGLQNSFLIDEIPVKFIESLVDIRNTEK